MLLHMLMEPNLIGYNIDSSTPMHFTGQEGNSCMTCGILSGCVGQTTSLAKRKNTDKGTASMPVTPVMLNIMGRKIAAAAAKSDIRSRIVISSVKLPLDTGLIWIASDAH